MLGSLFQAKAAADSSFPYIDLTHWQVSKDFLRTFWEMTIKSLTKPGSEPSKMPDFKGPGESQGEILGIAVYLAVEPTYECILVGSYRAITHCPIIGIQLQENC